MPWKAKSIMNLREEFVLLASQEGANRRELCRRFGISPQTAYKWIARYAKEGKAGLEDRSRRPHHQPARTADVLEQAVIDLRRQHPAWGGRKISRRLQDLGMASIAPSTANSILQRHQLIAPRSPEQMPWIRFEHEQPNALWQVDFKGYFDTLEGRCWPLTVLDDCSRFNVILQACSNMKSQTVQQLLMAAFRCYGLPVRMNFDNGAPWGSPAQPGQLTTLELWLIRLGIRTSHSRPYHPQTNGKDERFHRTLKAEVLNGRAFDSLAHTQGAFDTWRAIYNHERPHEALNMETPISRYRPSVIAFPEVLPEVSYDLSEEVVYVGWNGELKFRGRRFKVSNALHRQPVAIRPREGCDGIFDVYYAFRHCLEIDMREVKQHS